MCLSLFLSVAKESVPIKVTLPDGKVVEGNSWRTTPFNIAGMISKGLADNAVIAKVGPLPPSLFIQVDILLL